MALKFHLVVIDPQQDFADSPGSTLPVTGANKDMCRVADLIDRVGNKLTDVHVTLDSHHLIDVAHPAMWRNENGEEPAPFTLISANDLKAGIWTPRRMGLRNRMIRYTETLEAAGQYMLMVWPPHCLIGSPGHAVQPDLFAALSRWEKREFANVHYVTKGTNVFTEHYGALMAEVPDPSDPSTQLNTDFLNMLAEADIVAIAGEALSHCVKATVTQIADNIGEEHIRKLHILTDCTSPVPQTGNGPDFPKIAKDWLRKMEDRGLTLTTSLDFLS